MLANLFSAEPPASNMGDQHVPLVTPQQVSLSPAAAQWVPDLTHEYSRIGLNGVRGSLQTLFFPTMAPLFANRPLTTDEQRDLLAFLKDADQGHYPSGTPTARFAIVAVIGCLIFLGVTWTLGRRHVRSVRHALLKRAMQKRERLS